MDKFNDFFVNLADKMPFGKDFFKSNLPVLGIEINNFFLTLVSLLLVIVALVLVIALTISNKKEKKTKAKGAASSSKEKVNQDDSAALVSSGLVDKQPAKEKIAPVEKIDNTGIPVEAEEEELKGFEAKPASIKEAEKTAEPEQEKFDNFEEVSDTSDDGVQVAPTGLEDVFVEAKDAVKEDDMAKEPELNEDDFFKASDNSVIEEPEANKEEPALTKLVAASVSEAAQYPKAKAKKAIAKNKQEGATHAAPKKAVKKAENEVEASQPAITVESGIVNTQAAAEELTASQPVAAAVKNGTAAVSKKDADKRYSGKFEIYLTVSGYRFFLSASNGQLLYESNGYTSADGAMKGIETFKNAVPSGIFVVDEDKFGRFRYILNKRYAGENYTTKASCENSIESVKKFSQTAGIMPYIIDEAAEKAYADSMKARKAQKEVDWAKIEEEEKLIKPSGKFEISKGADGFRFDLVANNGQLLYASNGYASYKSAVEGIKNFKKTVYTGTFLVDEDKFGRFRYILRGATFNSTYIGESYTARNACEKIIQSVKKFVKSAVMPE